MFTSSNSSNGNWVALGTGAASGNGVSASSSSVSNLALASSGANVAVAWTQTVNSTQQIFRPRVHRRFLAAVERLCLRQRNQQLDRAGHVAHPGVRQRYALRRLARQFKRRGPDLRCDVHRQLVVASRSRRDLLRWCILQPRAGHAAGALEQRRPIVSRLDRQRIPKCPGQRRDGLRQVLDRLGVRRRSSRATRASTASPAVSASCSPPPWPWTRAAIPS